MMKCSDCRYSFKYKERLICNTFNPPADCKMLRSYDYDCGENAKYFEPTLWYSFKKWIEKVLCLN
jgi:hypothetical protein